MKEDSVFRISVVCVSLEVRDVLESLGNPLSR
jgi:hypothetical protein